MTTELKVGTLVLVAILVFAFFVIRIEGLGGFEDDRTYELRARFDNIAGLTRDAPVRLAGVQVGRVAGIHLTDDGRAEVAMRIGRDVVLHQDAVATVGSMGMLGEKYVEIQAGTAEAARVSDGDFIRGGRPTSIDQLVTVMSDISEDVQSTTESIRSVFGTEEAADRMRNIMRNVEDTTAAAQALVEENRRTVGGTTRNLDELTASLRDSLPELVAEMRGFAQNLDAMVDNNDERVANSLENIEAMSLRLDRSADELEQILSKINKGDGTLARLINEPQTVDKMNAALDSVDDALAAADTFFKRVGQAQFSFSLRSEFYADSEATKNYFGIRMGLGDVGNRAFFLEVVDDNVGRLSDTTVTTEVFDPMGNLLDRRRERRLITEEDFTFSALLGQRVGDWQFRGGLLEGDFGAGVDYFAGDDRWRFTVEAWDLGRDPDPHVKLRGQYALVNRLFLTAGWDELLNSERREFFVGAGFSFR